MVSVSRLKKIVRVGITTSIMLTSVAFTSETSKVGRISVNIEPEKGMSVSSVKKVLQTAVDQPLKSNLLQQDKQRLMKMARIRDVQIQTEQLEKGTKHLIFHVTQAPRLNTIRIKGNRRITEAELRSALNVSSGEIWTAAKRKSEAKRLRKVYGELKHCEDVNVKAQLHVDKQHQANVTWQIQERPVPHVKQIRFKNNIVFGEKKLLKQIKTKTSSFWNFFSNRDVFQRDVFQNDKERLKKFYHNKGYLAFEIENADVTYSNNGKNVHVSFTIQEGPLFTVRKIEVHGNKRIPDPSILSQLHSFEGMVYGQDSINADIETIKHVYETKGIENISCEVKLNKHPSRQRVDIIYEVQTPQSK